MMPACPRCGSRSVEIVFTPLTFLAHVVSNERRTRCPRCKWTGWKHKHQWAHIPGAGIWRGAGGIRARSNGTPLTETPVPADTPSDAAFEDMVAHQYQVPDIAAVDRTLTELDRTRTEDQTQRAKRKSQAKAAARARSTKASSASHAAAGVHSQTSRGTALQAAGRRSKGHGVNGPGGRTRLVRRRRRMERKQLIRVALAGSIVLAAVILTARACAA